MKGNLRSKAGRPGYWELRVDAGTDPVTRRRRQVSRGFRGTRKEAERALRELAGEVDAGKHLATEGTVAFLLERWFDHSVDSWSPTHVARVRGIIDHELIPTIGTVRLSKLQASDLDDLYRRALRGGQKAATVRKTHNTIRRALAQAVRWKWLAVNVATSASPPRLDDPDIRPPSPAQVAKLVEAIERTNAEFATFVRLAAATGARRGEVCGLRWGDLDLDAATLYINRSIAQVGKQVYVKGTKTHQARRIALGPNLMRYLAVHREAMERRAAKAGATLLPDAYVFSILSDCSKPWSPNPISIRWRRVIQSAGMKGTRLHDLRHLHATELLADGVATRTVSGRLGHRRTSTTSDIYAAWLPVSDRDAAERMERILAGP